LTRALTVDWVTQSFSAAILKFPASTIAWNVRTNVMSIMTTELRETLKFDFFELKLQKISFVNSQGEIIKFVAGRGASIDRGDARKPDMKLKNSKNSSSKQAVSASGNVRATAKTSKAAKKKSK
jgi:hypothetical protein